MPRLFALTFCALLSGCQEAASAHLTDITSTESADERDLANDATVYVTVSSDAVPRFTQALLGSGGTAASTAIAGSRDGVTALRLRESQLSVLSGVLHSQYHRCGGFEFHATQAEALAALTPVAPAQAAAAVSYTVDNAATVQTLMGGLAASNILAVDTHLASFTNRYYSSQTGVDAATWLKGTWQSLVAGRADATVETFTHAWAQPSVIVTLTGRSKPSEVVVLGAHLDSINQSDTAGVAPGADDDASGVATLTEVLRAIVASGYRPERTVKFMAYAAEEVGLRGSKDIAAKHKSDGVNVVGVLQFDMTNYKGSSADIVLFTDYTTAAQNTFMGTLIDTYVKVTRTTSSCGYACSDHASWYNQGYTTSLPFESLMSDYNPYIHTADDTLARSGGNTDNSLKFAKLAAAYVGELAKGTIGGGGGGTDAGVPDSTPPTVALTSPKAGASVSGVVTVGANASDDVGVAKVDFLVDGQAVGSDATPPFTVDWNSASASNGSHRLSARATDTSGNTALTGELVVQVSNVGPAIAVYDAARKAPACAATATACDSAKLLDGRGAVGPEVNKPNTINGSCADGASGSYHADESVDRIVVSSVDGANLGKGKQATIAVTIWAYSSFSKDALDVYAADNAASPSWKLVGTLKPTAAGAQTLKATYTLTTGATQAVRARLRYGGSAAACGTGSYDDHDDLVFAVQ